MPDTRKRHAVVLGAGLAGAATCVALARRGWRITLLDAASGPAMGASALPVGMLSPHVTRAPTPMSLISALGVQDMREQLARHIPVGQGWQPCEVDNLGHAPGRWPAALVRPAALVQAWLHEAQQCSDVEVRWRAPAAQLQAAGLHAESRAETSDPAPWQVLDGSGQVLAEAPTVVVAMAWGSFPLLHAALPGYGEQALPLRPVRGQMSLGAHTGDALAERPRRDNGVFVPTYTDDGLAPQWPRQIWAMGSTYTRGDDGRDLRAADHDRNAHSLAALCPPAAQRMQTAHAQGDLMGWAEVRCASLDRLPLAGPLAHLANLNTQALRLGTQRSRLPLVNVPRWPGLYTLTALGSRGLTLSHWCATQLAAQIDGAPLASDIADLWAKLDPARFAWKAVRRPSR